MPEKKKRTPDEIIEVLVVVMLGITALLTAWGSWIGSLHGGVQASSYTTSNNLASEGNSEYNAAVQKMNQDMILWNSISDMQLEITYYIDQYDNDNIEKLCDQLYYKLQENLSESMSEAIGWSKLTEEDHADTKTAILTWMQMKEAYTSPFFDEEYCLSYFETSNALLIQSQEVLKQGDEANANGDAFGLVAVIYSVVLFLLGIAGSFKKLSSKYALLAIALAAFIFATIYMITIPMPLDFSMSSFFGG